MDLSGVNLAGANLSHSDLNCARLSHADLSGAILSYSKVDEPSHNLLWVRDRLAGPGVVRAAQCACCGDRTRSLCPARVGGGGDCCTGATGCGLGVGTLRRSGGRPVHIGDMCVGRDQIPWRGPRRAQ